MQNNLTHLAQVFEQITDPRSKHGTYQPCAGILALTFLGLLAGQNYFTHIYRWAKNHWKTLKEPLGFNTKKPPDRTTLSRLLAKISLAELQEAFAVFLSELLQDKELVAAVDGKTSKQILDEDGEVLQMLNVFVHGMKVVLMEWSIKGDKTNEPGCLKQHFGELLAQFPNLKILTGDAIFAQRPLLRVLKDKVDYVFQVKDNQPEVLEAIKETFKDKESTEPVSKSFSKKKGFVEVRKLRTDSVNADWIREALDVPNCRSIFSVEWASSEEGVKPEIRFFISSLDLSDWTPGEILAFIRHHWSIENSLHFVKDRWRDEDRHYLSMSGLGERFTCLLNRAVSIGGLLKKGLEPLTAVAALVRDKPKKFLKRLGFVK